MRLALLAGSVALSGAVAAPPASDVPTVPEPPVVKSAPLSADEEARRDSLTRFGIGLIRARHDQIATAARQQEAAAKKQPNAAAPQKELAKLYAELGREPAAAAAGEKVLAADPNDLDTATLLGRLYADARRYADAVRVLKLAAASKELTSPVSKLVVLKDLARAADAALDPATAATARTDALALLKEHRVKFLHPDLLTVAELERERLRLYEGLGVALLRKSDFAAAVAAFENARDLAADPKGANDPAAVARLHWNLSGVREAEGQPAKALAELEKYLAYKPAAFEPYERFVQLMKQLKREGELPRKLAELADANPKNLAPQWLAAAIAMPTDPATAHELFRKLAEKGTTPDEYRVLAVAYRDANQPKDLLDLLDRQYKAVRPDGSEEPKPDAKVNPDAVVRSRLLTTAVRQLRPTFTAKLITQASADLTAGTVRHTDTLELLAGLAHRDGEVAAVADVLRGSAGRRAKDYRMKWLTVQAYTHLRRWERIIDESDHLSRVDGGRFYPDIVAQAAFAHAELGRKREALAVLKELGDTPLTAVRRAGVLNVLGDHAEALAECDGGLANEKLTPNEQRSLLLARATTLNHLRKYAEAEAIWRELLEINPDDATVLNNLGYELADQNRKLDEAEALLRRAVVMDKWERGRQGDPDAESGGYLDSLAWALFRRGKLKDARDLLEKAVTSPDANADGIVWDHLGDVAFRQDDKKRATEAWKKAAELYRGSHTGRDKGRLDEVKVKLKLAE